MKGVGREECVKGMGRGRVKGVGRVGESERSVKRGRVKGVGRGVCGKGMGRGGENERSGKRGVCERSGGE